jgi:SOS-response transcriptional repressor LexA
MLEYQAEHGAPPSVREMTRWLGASSTNAANDHLILMERKGMVRRYRRRARAWVPISPVNKEST